jgi:hypothetical protein
MILLDLPHPPERPSQSTLFALLPATAQSRSSAVDAQTVQAVLFARAVAHAAEATVATAGASAGATYIVHEPQLLLLCNQLCESPKLRKHWP